MVKQYLLEISKSKASLTNCGVGKDCFLMAHQACALRRTLTTRVARWLHWQETGAKQTPGLFAGCRNRAPHGERPPQRSSSVVLLESGFTGKLNTIVGSRRRIRQCTTANV